MVSPRRSLSIGRGRARGLTLGIACLLSAAPSTAAGQTEPVPPKEADAPQDLYLEVFRGDRSTHRIVHVRLHDGALSATTDELRAMGLAVPAELEEGRNGDPIPLEILPGLSYRYEPETQRLFLQVPTELQPVQHLGYERPGPVEAQRGAGWLLSYDAHGREIAGDFAASLAHQVRWFGPSGALEHSGVSRAADGAVGYRRLETRWTYSDPERLWTWTAGDLVGGGFPWTRPMRLAGLQWRRNFGVRPDLITIPMPRFTGEATVPASVELYVNNIRRFGGEVEEGPFVLDALPRISGSGQASLVVTDALGRVTRTTVPLYVDHRRLARGMTDFSVEVGVPRTGFGGDDDRYGRQPVASGSLRHGIADALTLEAHGEVTRDRGFFGTGAVWSPATRFGLLAGSFALGDPGRGGAGYQYALGYQWNWRGYGLDVARLRRGGGIRALEAVRTEEATAVAPSAESTRDRAVVWLPVGRGSLAFTWLSLRDRTDGRARWTRSLSWTQTVAGRVSLSLNLFDDREAGRGGGLSVSVPLGGRLRAGARVRHTRGRTSPSLTVRRSAPYGGGWGWSVQGDQRAGGWVRATTEVRGRLGEARFGVDRIDGRTGSFVQAGGSAVLMDGRLFLSRRIHDAFAVVSTARADVPILNENRPYGRTGPDGYLLVPDLRGWQRNRVAIDPEELGPNVRLGALEQTATPADRSGVLLRFDMAEIRPALVALLGPDGEAVPAGTRAVVVEGGGELVIGFGGEAYVDDASTALTLELVVGGVRCRYRVPAVEAPEGRPAATRRVGPLPCEEMGS